VVDYGSLAVFFSVVLLWTHVVIPVSTISGGAVALRTSPSTLRGRGVANVGGMGGRAVADLSRDTDRCRVRSAP
jgi:hypothetical protein